MKLFLLVLCLYSVNALPKQKIGQRIIGGERARAGQFPFAAAVYTQTSTGHYFCGGALISNLWVLSAAHCLENVVVSTIHLGSNSLSLADPNVVKLASDNFIIHPSYSAETLNHDLGLIELRLPVVFSDYLKPVDFLPSNILGETNKALAIGWGQVGDDKEGISDVLRYVEVTVLSNTECRFTFGNQITENMVCVGGNFNEGACNGDAGSPLIQTINVGYSVLVGTSSFLSANGCESPDPSGYARVYSANDWIRNVSGRF